MLAGAQWLAKVVWTNAAEIDKNGNYWSLRRFGAKLYKTSNVATLVGYSSYGSHLPDHSNVQDYAHEWTGDPSAWKTSNPTRGYADLTSVTANLGEGTQDYLLALSTKKSTEGDTKGSGVLLVIRISGEHLVMVGMLSWAMCRYDRTLGTSCEELPFRYGIRRGMEFARQQWHLARLLLWQQGR